MRRMPFKPPIGGPRNGRPPTMTRGWLGPQRKARITPVIPASEGRQYLFGKMRGNKPYAGRGRSKGL